MEERLKPIEHFVLSPSDKSRDNLEMAIRAMVNFHNELPKSYKKTGEGTILVFLYQASLRLMHSLTFLLTCRIEVSQQTSIRMHFMRICHTRTRRRCLRNIQLGMLIVNRTQLWEEGYFRMPHRIEIGEMKVDFSVRPRNPTINFGLRELSLLQQTQRRQESPLRIVRSWWIRAWSMWSIMIHQPTWRYKQQCHALRLQQSREQVEQAEIVRADVLDWLLRSSGIGCQWGILCSHVWQIIRSCICDSLCQMSRVLERHCWIRCQWLNPWGWGHMRSFHFRECTNKMEIKLNLENSQLNLAVNQRMRSSCGTQMNSK